MVLPFRITMTKHTGGYVATLLYIREKIEIQHIEREDREKKLHKEREYIFGKLFYFLY